MNNILVVAITRLGDMLQSSPTIAGLKAHNPDARITVLIEKQFAKICSGIPAIDEVYVIDLSYVCRCLHRERDGIVEAFRYLDEMLADLRERKFDCCINMSNSSYTALLLKMLDAKINTGWLADAEGFRLMADPWAMLFSAFVYHQNRDYNCLNLVDIFRCAAGVTKHPRHLCYNVSPSSRVFAEQFLQEHRLTGPGPLICIQAGASQGKRQWGVARFSRLAQILVEQMNARVIFTGSPDEKDLIEQILKSYSNPRVVSAAGKTNFDQLGGILERAGVLITGDTGPMHLAVASGTPVVALFLASALCFETGPYSEGNFVLQTQISCSPCNPNYPCSRPDCHAQISPELVAYVAQLRLTTARGEEGSVSIPAAVADPRKVVVYRTAFDEDGFLTFEPLNGIAPRHGEPLGFFETARKAYAALWKEEFSGIACRELMPRFAGELPVLHNDLAGLQGLIDLTRAGVQTVDQLAAVIRDIKSPPRLLSEIDQKLQFIDKELESVSLAYPMTGALVRIFIMEKENMRGDDPLMLAEQTKVLYLQLERRCRRFWQLFVHFAGKYMEGGAR